MKKKYHNSSTDLEDLGSLEAHLAGTLRPVQPSRELVYRLRGRIHIPRRAQIVSRLNNWRSLYLTLGGVLSGMLAIITIGRALYYLFTRRSA